MRVSPHFLVENQNFLIQIVQVNLGVFEVVSQVKILCYHCGRSSYLVKSAEGREEKGFLSSSASLAQGDTYYDIYRTYFNSLFIRLKIY